MCLTSVRQLSAFLLDATDWTTVAGVTIEHAQQLNVTPDENFYRRRCCRRCRIVRFMSDIFKKNFSFSAPSCSRSRLCHFFRVRLLHFILSQFHSSQFHVLIANGNWNVNISKSNSISPLCRPHRRRLLSLVALNEQNGFMLVMALVYTESCVIGYLRIKLGK